MSAFAVTGARGRGYHPLGERHRPRSAGREPGRQRGERPGLVPAQRPDCATTWDETQQITIPTQTVNGVVQPTINNPITFTVLGVKVTALYDTGRIPAPASRSSRRTSRTLDQAFGRNMFAVNVPNATTIQIAAGVAAPDPIPTDLNATGSPADPFLTNGTGPTTPASMSVTACRTPRAASMPMLCGRWARRTCRYSTR